MNFAQNGYSEEEVLNMLTASSRKVFYEYTFEDTAGNVYPVSITDGKITFDSNAEVMRSFSGSMKKTDFMTVNTVEARLIPWLCLETANDVLKWPLGKFIISGDSKCEDGYETIEISGYDYGKIALDEGMSNRTYFKTGTVYTSAVSQLLGEVYRTYNVDEALQTLENDLEWDVGTTRLEVINLLLEAINYNPVHFDEYGTGQCDAYVFPKLRNIDIQYHADARSIIKDGITKKSNKFEVPNKFVRYTEDADSNYYISTYVNEDENDPYSTVNRGRVITDIDSVDEIASQGDLDAYVRKIAQEKRMAVDTIDFTSLCMPCHGFMNCVFLVCDIYEIAGKYIETGWEMELAPGGTMSHTLQKVSEL